MYSVNPGLFLKRVLKVVLQKKMSIESIIAFDLIKKKKDENNWICDNSSRVFLHEKYSIKQFQQITT